MSEDPVGFLSGDFNLYRYVKNQPSGSSDPSGNGPVSGGVCLVADLSGNFALSYSEWQANIRISEAYEFAIKNAEKELNERCPEDSLRRSELKTELLKLKVKQAEAQLLAAKAITEGLGNTVAGGIVCAALTKIPFIP